MYLNSLSYIRELGRSRFDGNKTLHDEIDWKARSSDWSGNEVVIDDGIQPLKLTGPAHVPLRGRSVYREQVNRDGRNTRCAHSAVDRVCYLIIRGGDEGRRSIRTNCLIDLGHVSKACRLFYVLTVW